MQENALLKKRKLLKIFMIYRDSYKKCSRNFSNAGFHSSN